jgi:hypothetical protein
VVPAEKMKMRDDHEVPLSRQALAILAVLDLMRNRGLSWLVGSPDIAFADGARATLEGWERVEV